MTQIVLTAEQATILANSAEPVAVCRPDGSIAGLISPKTRIVIPEKCPFTAEEIVEAERAAAATTRRYTTKEVLDYARAHERP